LDGVRGVVKSDTLLVAKTPERRQHFSRFSRNFYRTAPFGRSPQILTVLLPATRFPANDLRVAMEWSVPATVEWKENDLDCRRAPRGDGKRFVVHADEC
jgi:hypothetical protein